MFVMLVLGLRSHHVYYHISLLYYEVSPHLLFILTFAVENLKPNTQ